MKAQKFIAARQRVNRREEAAWRQWWNAAAAAANVELIIATAFVAAVAPDDGAGRERLYDIMVAQGVPVSLFPAAGGALCIGVPHE